MHLPVSLTALIRPYQAVLPTRQPLDHPAVLNILRTMVPREAGIRTRTAISLSNIHRVHTCQRRRLGNHFKCNHYKSAAALFVRPIRMGEYIATAFFHGTYFFCIPLEY